MTVRKATTSKPFQRRSTVEVNQRPSQNTPFVRAIAKAVHVFATVECSDSKTSVHLVSKQIGCGGSLAGIGVPCLAEWSLVTLSMYFWATLIESEYSSGVKIGIRNTSLLSKSAVVITTKWRWCCFSNASSCAAFEAAYCSGVCSPHSSIQHIDCCAISSGFWIRDSIKYPSGAMNSGDSMPPP